MSQAILQELARLKKANEALAERVTILEQARGEVPTPTTSEIHYQLTKLATSPAFVAAVAANVKRGPGRPRKDAAADGNHTEP